MQLRVIVGAVVAVAAVVVGLALLIGTGTTQTRSKSPIASASGPGVEFAHPAAWTQEGNAPDDTTAGILVKLERSDPDGSFILRRIVGRLEQPLDMAKLATETEAALAAQIEGFAPVANETVQVSGRDVLRISYLQNRTPTAYRAVLMVAPMATKTYYLTFRAPVDDFNAIESEIQQIAGNVLAIVKG